MMLRVMLARPLDMLTTTGTVVVLRRGKNELVTLATLATLVSMTLAHAERCSASDASEAGILAMPALLTRTSSFPKRVLTASVAATTDKSEDTSSSSCSRSAVTPFSRKVEMAAGRLPAFRAAMMNTSLGKRVARACTMHRPMPLFAPVTRMCFAIVPVSMLLLLLEVADVGLQPYIWVLQGFRAADNGHTAWTTAIVVLRPASTEQWGLFSAIVHAGAPKSAVSSRPLPRGRR